MFRQLVVNKFTNKFYSITNCKTCLTMFLSFFLFLSCTIILCLWAVSHVLISPVYLDFTTVIELQLTATLLLIFIFGPKLYVLLFYEPVVVECFYGGGSGSSLNRNSKTTNITSTCSDLF